MLDTSFAVANSFLPLGSHSWPQESVLQQAQHLLLALMSSIPMTSIQSCHSMSLGDQESQNLLQLTSRGVAMVEC